MYWKPLNQTISWIHSKRDGVVFSRQLILSVSVLVCLSPCLFVCLFFCWCVTQSGDLSHTTNACLMDPHLLATGSKYCLFQSAPLFFQCLSRGGGVWVMLYSDSLAPNCVTPHYDLVLCNQTSFIWFLTFVHVCANVHLHPSHWNTMYSGLCPHLIGVQLQGQMESYKMGRRGWRKMDKRIVF